MSDTDLPLLVGGGALAARRRSNSTPPSKRRRRLLHRSIARCRVAGPGRFRCGAVAGRSSRMGSARHGRAVVDMRASI